MRFAMFKLASCFAVMLSPISAGAFSHTHVASSAKTKPRPEEPAGRIVNFSPLKKHTTGEILLLTRKIRACGADVAESLRLLRDWLPSPTSTSLPVDELLLQYEPACMEALGVVSRAQRQLQTGVIRLPADARRQQELLQTVLDLYEKCPTDSCRARTISICGSSSLETGYPVALALLRRGGERPPSIQCYNAALAACAASRDWSEARGILLFEMPHASTLSCNIVLTAMERAKQGSHARELLQDMVRDQQQQQQQKVEGGLPPPDRLSFHLTMSALIDNETIETDATGIRRGSGNYTSVDDAFNLLRTMQLLDDLYASNKGRRARYPKLHVRPNNATFDLLASAYGRCGDWAMARMIDSLRHRRIDNESEASSTRDEFPDPERYRSSACTSSNTRHSPLILRWEDELLLGMERDAKEKCWKFAVYQDPVATLSLTVALKPHRNPAKNGIKILLFDNHSNCSKVGYLLMINNHNEAGVASSTLLGVFLAHSGRKKGLSKVLLAIWLDLCRRAEIAPRTGAIHKPLLALVLQHTFGFQPRGGKDDAGGRHASVKTASKSSTTGVYVEVSPGRDGTAVELYAPSLKSLQGAFTLWDMKRENIRLLQEAPSPRGRPCLIGGTFEVGNNVTTATKIDRQLAGKTGTGALIYNSMTTCWRGVFLGS